MVSSPVGACASRFHSLANNHLVIREAAVGQSRSGNAFLFTQPCHSTMILAVDKESEKKKRMRATVIDGAKLTVPLSLYCTSWPHLTVSALSAS